MARTKARYRRFRISSTTVTRSSLSRRFRLLRLVRVLARVISGSLHLALPWASPCGSWDAPVRLTTGRQKAMRVPVSSHSDTKVLSCRLSGNYGVKSVGILWRKYRQTRRKLERNARRRAERSRMAWPADRSDSGDRGARREGRRVWRETQGARRECRRVRSRASRLRRNRTGNARGRPPGRPRGPDRAPRTRRRA
jgi:hypothetical protein